MTKTVSLIVAIGPKGVIGYKDKLLWKSKEDLNYFRIKTDNHPCVFGSTTFYGLPKYPLRNRLNIVLDDTQKEEIVADNRGWITCNSFESALLFSENYDEIFICGGKSIYEYALKYNFVNRIYLTTVSSTQLEQAVEKDKKKQLVYLNISQFVEDWNRYFLKRIEEQTDSGDTLSIKFEVYEKNDFDKF